MRDRLTAGQRTLNPLAEVRVLLPQPFAPVVQRKGSGLRTRLLQVQILPGVLVAVYPSLVKGPAL